MPSACPAHRYFTGAFSFSLCPTLSGSTSRYSFRNSATELIGIINAVFSPPGIRCVPPELFPCDCPTLPGFVRFTVSLALLRIAEITILGY